ncbi:TIGR04222 domain-containing membrane protein [Streptomyces sp. PKU-EA00015]|uniref:TIGR04222 domain-containing membrane protein n=1 Tax=Streptomyces sp. PKU-EA00015 TaxID=2748326 RepID=UPI0015A0C5BD|nr:TIGR04222 domain-containing membrane protein [Streptomyces sp. PKU-EA00015]NWF26536.1 TIGR04222 domain-containing membrane protein [Streptomyces sp. PKU-EA00015]
MPLDMWWFTGAACVVLAAAAVLLRAGTPGPDATIAPGPQSVALLRGGRRAAVTVALVALQQRGVVTSGRRGTVRIDGWAAAVRDPLQLAVHTSLRRPAGIQVLLTVPRVQRALDGLRDQCAAQGLLRPRRRWHAARALLVAVPVTVLAGLMVTTGSPAATAAAAAPVAGAVALWFVPRQTPAARHLLASLREAHPLPGRPLRGSASVPRVQMSVALHGDRALLLHLPHFARDGGLLARGSRETGFMADGTSPGRGGAPSCGGGPG